MPPHPANRGLRPHPPAVALDPRGAGVKTLPLPLSGSVGHSGRVKGALRPPAAALDPSSAPTPAQRPNEGAVSPHRPGFRQGIDRKPQRSAGAAEHRTGEDRSPAGAALDRLTKDKLRAKPGGVKRSDTPPGYAQRRAPAFAFPLAPQAPRSVLSCLAPQAPRPNLLRSA